jgi:hypothetical protein
MISPSYDSMSKTLLSTAYLIGAGIVRFHLAKTKGLRRKTDSVKIWNFFRESDLIP